MTKPVSAKDLHSSQLADYFAARAMTLAEHNLDPNSVTGGGIVSAGQNVLYTVRGQWTPGEGHPWWGPEGDPGTPFNGVNKWSVICIVRGWNQSVLWAFQWPGDGRQVNIPGIDSPAVFVEFRMNDDRYGDNRNHPDNPMRFSP